MNRSQSLWILIAVIVIFITRQFLSATKNAPPENLQGFVINLYFDGENLTTDPGFPKPIDTTITSPQPIKSGDFKVEIHSLKNKILFTTFYKPNFGSNILYIPYYLNASVIKIMSPSGKIQSISTEGLFFCNENNSCELGEENLCPLDCESAKNPNYPLTPAGKISDIQKSQPQPLEKPAATFTPELAKNQFQNYLIFLGISAGFLLILFFVLNWYNKRK